MIGAYALNTETRDEKIIQYLPLVKFIASRVFISKASAVDMDDLIGYGVIGLIDAIDKFDPSKGVKFETYASLRIKGAIIDELRKLNWMPRTALAKVSRLNEVRDVLKIKLGREPDDKELASELNISVEEMRKTESYVNYLSVVSLDEVIFQPGDDELAVHTTVEDVKSPRPDSIVEDREKHVMLKRAVEMMNDKDRLILNLYYFEKLTLKEIGHVLEVSESRVSQLHSRAILRLKENLARLNYCI